MWTGLALGTTLAVLAMMNGVRLKVGGTPPLIGWFLGGLIIWLMVVGAATLVAELLRRHHREIGRYAGRQAGRGARHGLGFARRHGGRGLHAAGRWTDRRWRARQAGPQPGPAREPLNLGAALTARWRAGRRQPAGTQPFTDPNPTPVDGLPVVPPAEAGPAAGAGGAWGDPVPDCGYGAGPWMLAVRRKDGRPYYDGPGGSQVGSALVRDPGDLRRRLEAAATDPDVEVRVAPVKVTDPGLVLPVLDPAVNEEVRRQACEWARARGVDLEPGEVIAGADGSVTIDQRLASRSPDPSAMPITDILRWARDGSGPAGVAVFSVATGRPVTSPAGGTVPPADTENQHGGTEMSTGTYNAAEQQARQDLQAGRQPLIPLGTLPQQGRRTARTATAPEPNGVWKSVISSTHGFEPENDGHLLGWMAGEAGGMSGYAEEIADVYETAVCTIGLDPVAMAALHDYADAAATAAEAMARARQRFADHYSEVRAFTANGGVLPYNGRWMTGEGD
jgi:hypothetical protein